MHHLCALLLLAMPALAQTRYALILDDPPLETSRETLRQELTRRAFPVPFS
jgi:hypothetical protein